MAILLDFSQTVLSACYSFESELSVNNPDKEGACSIVRHVILSQIKYWLNKYRYNYGQLVICCDGRHYWRKEIFKHYKANRKKIRSKSNLDWKLIYDIMDKTIEDLKENFPYKVVKVDRAECDDVIAVLSKYYQTHELKQTPLYEEPQKIVIISSDKDFVQLQKYRNVVQVSPRTRSFVNTDDPVFYLKEKVIRGDRGDGIPNILNEDDIYVVEGYKSTAMTKKRFDALISQTPETCTDKIISERWARNQKLIDFDYIPKDVEESILEEYAKPIKGSKGKAYEYLIKYQCYQLLQDIDNF